MGAKHDLQHSMIKVLEYNKDGSFNTQHARKKALLQSAAQLCDGGYKLGHVQGLKQKHIRYLNEKWKGEGISAATIKNRNAHLRWVCHKIGKRDVVQSNDELGIAKRKYVTNEDKSVELDQIDFKQISSPHVRVQLHLQRHLGLRREEVIKFKPHQADKGDHIELQASWCKGGRARTVPVLTAEARQALEEAKKLAENKGDSLIKNDQSYKTARKLYENQTQRAGLKHAHGLRHAYAQQRYKELTGWDAPCRGGPKKSEMTPTQKARDKYAREILTAVLGHSRTSIVARYIGS